MDAELRKNARQVAALTTAYLTEHVVAAEYASTLRKLAKQAKAPRQRKPRARKEGDEH
jgi:hypothetical protein